MYSLAFGISGLIFAYVSVKSTKIYYKIMFALICVQCCALAGASVLNTTQNYGNNFYAMCMWVLILVPSLYAIDIIARTATGMYRRRQEEKNM